MGLAVLGRVQERHLVAVENWGIGARIAHACYGIGFYALKTIVPRNITHFYAMPARVVWYELPYVAYIVGTVAVSVALFLLLRRRPALLAVWLSYLVILAPNSGLMRIGAQIAADRYSYIAMLGVVVLVAAGLVLGLQAARRAWAWPVAAAWTAASLGVPLGLIVLSWDQCRVWRTSEGLWRHALNHGAIASWGAHNNLGVILSRQGRPEEAWREFSQALALNPTYADAHNNIGMLLKAQGRLAEAQNKFTEALRLNPALVDAHNNLGGLLARQGRTEEAREEFDVALRIDPRSADAHSNLGALLNTQGRLAEADAELDAALRLNPGLADAHNNRGVLLGKQGRLEEARAEFAAAAELKPDFADPHYNLGLLLMQQGRLLEASAEFSQALRLKPDYAEAHNNLGVLLFQQGRLAGAQDEFAAALRINPAFRDARNNLETVRNAQGRLEEAGTRSGEAHK
jgi:Tfp pilus assembly protein PilF